MNCCFIPHHPILLTLATHSLSCYFLFIGAKSRFMFRRIFNSLVLQWEQIHFDARKHKHSLTHPPIIHSMDGLIPVGNYHNKCHSDRPFQYIHTQFGFSLKPFHLISVGGYHCLCYLRTRETIEHICSFHWYVSIVWLRICVCLCVCIRFVSFTSMLKTHYVDISMFRSKFIWKWKQNASAIHTNEPWRGLYKMSCIHMNSNTKSNSNVVCCAVELV